MWGLSPKAGCADAEPTRTLGSEFGGTPGLRTRHCHSPVSWLEPLHLDAPSMETRRRQPRRGFRSEEHVERVTVAEIQSWQVWHIWQ